MAKNPFPKGSRVRLLFCQNPGCKCRARYREEDGIVRNALGRFLRVELAPYEGLMSQWVHFRKETAEAHLERLDKPVRRKSNGNTGADKEERA